MVTNSINENTLQLVEDFQMFYSWEDKYSYIIDLGKQMEPLSEKEKVATSKVEGCVSQVWLVHHYKEGKLYINATSDSYIVQGLIAIICKVFSGQEPCNIINFDIEKFFTQMELKEHLTPSRSNGFFSIVQRIKAIATQFD